MNRFRRLAGPNSYASELGIDVPALLPHGGRWLDIGCGTGVAVRELARSRPDVAIVALDLEAGFVDGRPVPSNLHFIRGDAERLPVKGLFDLVTATHVLHFIGDKQACLKSLAARLRPGGRLFANLDPNDLWLGNDWQTARRIGGDPFIVTEPLRWGTFQGWRSASEGNRQGVTSRQSLYSPQP